MCACVFHFICMRAGHGFARVFLFIMMASPSSRDYRTESPSSPTVSNNEGELHRLEARAGLQIWTWPIYYRLKLSENLRETEERRSLCAVQHHRVSLTSNSSKFWSFRRAFVHTRSGRQIRVHMTYLYTFIFRHTPHFCSHYLEFEGIQN